MCLTRSEISYVLDFLADLFDESHQYNTIGLHKSALLAFHDLIQGIKIGDHPKVLVLCLESVVWVTGVAGSKRMTKKIEISSFKKYRVLKKN